MRKSKTFQLFLCVFICSTIGFLFSCGKSSNIESKTKTNSPPVISSANILPEKPNKESEFNLSIQSKDSDGDSVTYQFQWIRNDEEIIGENKNALRSGLFKKGDLIRVRVTPSDGKVNGTPFLSAPVKIFNSPPVLKEVWIEPKGAYVTDRLKANLKSLDLDRDFIYYTYQWEKNGVVLNEERGEILDRGLFSMVDSFTIIVIPK